MNDAGVLPAFTGIAVHDAWAPYFTCTNATHALCGAHVLRELTAVAETTEEAVLPWAEHAATDLRVPFDNNAAEREVRMIKIRQKISGCMRTMVDATGFCTIRSYLATTRKHGSNYYDALRQLADGQAWTPTHA